MRVVVTLDLTDADLEDIGREDGRPGRARRRDVRAFVSTIIGEALAGEGRFWFDEPNAGE